MAKVKDLSKVIINFVRTTKLVFDISITLIYEENIQILASRTADLNIF